MVSTKNFHTTHNDRYILVGEYNHNSYQGVPHVPCAMSNVDNCTLSVQFLNGSSFTLTLPCSTLGRDVQQTISEGLGGKAAAGVSLAYHDARLRFLDKNDRIMEHPTLKTLMKTNTRWWFQRFGIFTLTWGNDPV